MRTGAIFARRARGSCGALKWTALLGAFLVLGSVQAVAQPTIEDAYVVVDSLTTDAEPYRLYVTMSEPVYGTGAVELLPGDFTLTAVGGTAATTPPVAYRIDGLEESRLSADDSFVLTFDEAVAGRSLLYAGPQTEDLTTSPPVYARSIENQQGEQLAALVLGTNEIAIRSHPTQERELTLTLKPPVRVRLEMARMRGQVYQHSRTFVAAKQKAAIDLPAAEGPPGTPLSGSGAINYLLESSRLNITGSDATPTALTGLYFQHTPKASRTATVPEIRALSGTMPDAVGDYDITYTAFLDDDDSGAINGDEEWDSVTFKLKVADVPEAPTITKVETASNSSLKVTWSAPRSDNNDKILRYQLRYRLDDQDDQVDTWKTPVETATATTSHTLAGLDPGNYEVAVRAINSIAADITNYTGGWSEIETGSTGTGAQKPTLTLTVGSSLPEGQDTIPVTVTATVDPSAEPVRTLKVQLKLLAQKTRNPETDAELPSKTGLPAGVTADVTWDSPAADPVLSQAVELTFTSNLSSERTVYLSTGADDDAEDENFRITATSTAETNIFSAVTAADTTAVKVDDDEEQVYALGLPYQVEVDKGFMEGYGGADLPVNLVVSPGRTVPTNYIVSLTSAQDSSDYSLLSPSSGSPSSVGTRVGLMAGSTGEELTLTAAQNDGDRVDDTITLQLFKANAAGVKGDQLGDDIVLMVLDRHMLPTVTRGAIMVDGNAVTSLAEGEMGTVELLVPRGTTTDAIPDGESIKVMLSLAPTSEAGADDFRLGSPEVSVGTKTSATFELEALVDDADVDDEMLVLQAEVTGSATNGPGATVDLAAITITDGTMKLVWAKTQAEVETAVYDAKMDGMGADEMFTAGEMIEVMGSALFNAAEGVTLSYSAESSDAAVASTMSGDGMVTVTAMGEGDAMITITAHASMPSGVKINDQTDPREASITFPVEVGLEALSFMLMGPDDMNIVEGGMAHANGTMGAAMLTVTANRAVGMDTEVMVMRDRALSTAMDSDYMPVPTMITIESGETMGSVEITATEDNMAEDMEELVLYAMVGDMMVEGKAKLYIWDAAVPALPIIAQLLLAAFLAIGGYRRYLRR